MRIALTKPIIILTGIASFLGMLHAYEPQIKLVARKDIVMSVEIRETVLRVGLTHLTKDTDDYMAVVEGLEDPFAFESPEEVKPVVEEGGDVAPPEPVSIDYDDATVLKVASKSFSKRVRGSIARGDSIFLQLEGGTLFKPGASFKVRLPKADAFTITVTEITSRGYTLQTGGASKTFTFDNSSKSGTGSIQLTNPK